MGHDCFLWIMLKLPTAAVKMGRRTAEQLAGTHATGHFWRRL